MTPCIFVYSCQHFRKNCLHLQGSRKSWGSCLLQNNRT